MNFGIEREQCSVKVLSKTRERLARTNKVSLDVSVVKLWQILKKPTVLSPAAQQLTIFATSIG